MPESSVILHERAPAKVNLFLRVLGTREDGFHEIETLMAPIDLHDELTLEINRRGDGNVRCNVEGMADVPEDESNLAVKAAWAWMHASGINLDVTIKLQKSIPSGAGLGGGSSDAAAVLRAINGVTSDSSLSLDELGEVAAELGSDVPFFLLGSPALCMGRGEKITAFEGVLPDCNILLVKPPFGVSTPDAYRRWKNAAEISGVDYGAQLVDGVTLENDLERPVFEKFLVLADLKTWLRKQDGVRAALMSGSGATVYAVMEQGVPGTKLAEDVKGEFGESFWVNGSRLFDASSA